LRSSSVKTRLAVVAKLADSRNEDSVKPLLFALKDKDEKVRHAATQALEQIPSGKMVAPLIQMLRDSLPVARTLAAEILGRLKDTAAIKPLIGLLRDADPAVRLMASRSLDQLAWHPETEEERKAKILADGNLDRVIELGAEGIQPLIDLMRNGTPDKQIAAVRALCEIEDPRVVELMLEALKKEDTMIRLLALDHLGRLADPAAFETLEHLLKDKASNIRAGAISAAVKCGGSRAVPMLVPMLKDPSWEVRFEAVKALGKINDTAAVDGLCGALQDHDHDVRENAAVALGNIRDPRAIRHLVLALMDVESFVRSAAKRSLAEIDPNWKRTEAAQSTLPQVKVAVSHREYWISQSAAKLRELLQAHSNAGKTVPPAVNPMDTSHLAVRKKSMSPPAIPIPAVRAAPANLTAEPAKITRLDAFAILQDLLGDHDRDLRLAAAQAFGQLNDKNAVPLLASIMHDEDVFVRQAAEHSLMALN